jgi:MraZ protein
MLLGKTNITLDTKGRIAIPARYREQLVDLCDGKLVVALNPIDGCLNIYPHGEWLKCMRKMDQVQNKSHDFRELQRVIYANANEIDMDGSGRVLIPQELRDTVGLQKNAVLVGHNDKFELWSEDDWLRVSKEGTEKLMKSMRANTDRPDIGFTM